MGQDVLKRMKKGKTRWQNTQRELEKVNKIDERRCAT
jgi:hypothetical protein